MLWSTLFNHIGRQPMRITNHPHVYALINDPKTHDTHKVWLCLKYDKAGRPYLVEDLTQKDKTEGKPGNYKHKKSLQKIH